MNYKQIYDELISFRRENPAKGYIEKHHIQMRSLGGSDDESNLVSLTGREHYVAHLLLARFNRCSQTAYALWMMQCRSNEDKNIPSIKSSRMYEWARKEFAKYISRDNKIASKGERNSQHGTRWICNIEIQENKKISKDSPIPKNWILGRSKWIKKENRTRRKTPLSITNGKTTKRLFFSDQKIPHGWSTSLVELHFNELNDLMQINNIPFYKACQIIGISFNSKVYNKFKILKAAQA